MSESHAETPPSVSSEPAFLTLVGPVATVTLNRPDSFNAIDVAIAKKLRELGREIAAREEVRVVVINGSGLTFCAGGDIAVFAANLGKLAPIVDELLGAYHSFLEFLIETPKLVITSVHGAAAGAGLSLAFMGDLCIASEDARFMPGYVNLGVSPDGGGTVGLVEAVGPRRALQIFLAEDQISAQQAEQWGLVNKVVPANQLREQTEKLAQRLARNEPTAVAATKALIKQSRRTAPRDQFEAERQRIIECMATQGFEDAVRRFVKK